MSIDAAELRRWIGRRQHDSETLTPRLVRQFNATLGSDGGVAPGDPAPPLIHWCLTQPVAPMSALGRDGHPALGGFLPPVPLPRRMWAGGEIAFHHAARIGDTVNRASVISDVAVKQGRSGTLCFVTVTHEYSADGRALCTERQDIVYRDAATKETPRPATRTAPPAAPEGAEIRTVQPHPTLLFRYSAMTFNGHRIHYDRRFCTEEEGYAGLVVHGPLQATLLCHFAAELRGQPPARFRFRSLSVLCDDQDFDLHAMPDEAGIRLWTAYASGPVAMEAQAGW